MCRDGLAVRHDHDFVDIALDRHHPEREQPGHAVTVAVEGDGLVLIHGDRRVDHTRVEPMAGQRQRRGQVLGESVLDGERTEAWTGRPGPARPRSACERTCSIHQDFRHEARAWRIGCCTALTVPSASGFSLPRAGMQKSGVEERDGWPAPRSADGSCRSRPWRIKVATVLGLSHQTSLGTRPKNSKAVDHAFEDRLGAFEGERQDEGSVGVGPGRHQKGDRACDRRGSRRGCVRNRPRAADPAGVPGG